MALPPGLVEREIEREPTGRAGGHVDRAPLFDRARGGRMMKTLVKVIDDPQSLERPAGAIDQLHLEGNLLSHPRGERAGDVDEHRILGPRLASDACQQAEGADEHSQRA